jgi:tryptophan synthase alpha chain
LDARFAALRAEGRAGLIAYLMAGDPDMETCGAILDALPAAGADIIELGFPFSDPMADGPTIQKAAQRALAAGTTLAATLELARRFRAGNEATPLVLMGYANPVEQMGPTHFAAAAATAGVDGAIIVDLPPEEDQDIRAALTKNGISLIRLATPTTDDARLSRIIDGLGGFLYYVSITGVTGAAAARTDAESVVRRLQEKCPTPVAVGFGVREPETARQLARTADAVVVGSAFVDAIAEAVAEGRPHEAQKRVVERVDVLARAVRAARR